MIRIVDFINKLFNVIKKNEFKFECTYIWASLISNLFLLALTFCSFFLTVSLFIAVLYENLRYFGIDWAEQIRNFNIFFSSENKPKLEVIIGGNLSLLAVIGIHLLWVYEKEIFSFLSRISDNILDKFCKRLPESNE